MARDTIQTLKAEIEKLKAMMGVKDVRPTGRPEDRADYIAHGSPEHAAFLGLIEATPADLAEKSGVLVHASAVTEAKYRLADQVTAFMRYPDPMKIAQLVLTQKVNALDSGQPKVPENAPSMWVPVDQYYVASVTV